MAVASLFLPTSVDEAVALLGEHGSDLLVLGGGTIVMGAVNDGTLLPRLAMSLGRAGMNEVERANGNVDIGATTTAARLAAMTELPALAQAAGELGGPALRAMATIGGNLFTDSPYGDLAVALLALDAEVELGGPAGRRWLPLDAFLAERRGSGAVGRELVTRLRVPRPDGVTAYHKLARRQANTPSVVAVATRIAMDAEGRCRDVRIALGAAAPVPTRARHAEAALRGQPLDEATIAAAIDAAVAEADPPTDALASAWYRRRMVGVIVRRALAAAGAVRSPAA